MKQVKLELAKIVGTPSPTSWSQVHTFFPDDQEKLSKRGKLLAVICLKSTEMGIETVALGREILNRLNEEYYGNLEGKILLRLRAALEKIKTEWPETEVTVGVIFPAAGRQILYASILGNGKIFLKRGDFLTELLTGINGAGIEIGSGVVKTGDVILLGSGSFFEIVSEGVLKASLGLENPQEMVESLAPIVLSRSDLSQAAAVICRLAEEEESETFAFDHGELEKKADTPDLEKKNLYKIFTYKFSELRKRIFSPGRSAFYIRREEIGGQKSNSAIWIAAILIILFLSSLFFGIAKKNNLEKENKIKALLSQAEEKYNNAKDLIELDPEKSVVLLEESLKILAEAKKIKPPDGGQKIVLLRQETEKLLNESKNDFDLGELPVFFDLGLIKDQAKGAEISRFQNQLAILDKERASVYLLNLEQKSSSSFSDERLAKGEKIIFDGKIVYVLTSEGILSLDFEGKKMITIIPKDPNWGSITALGLFAGNLYLLDNGEKTIWQYPKTGTGFGQIKNWLLSNTTLKNDDLRSFAIDGAIWVLGGQGKIIKFIRGNEEKFSVTGLKKEIGEANMIFTDEESSYIYILNKVENKLILVSKEGKFKQQYNWKNPNNPNLLTVQEKKKKVFVILNNSIFSFSLNENL